jgi:hypothetical protein
MMTNAMSTVSIHEPVKLLHPVPDFSFFADDQVLTAGQLNRVIQYLDLQDRASRAWLVGAGIVCGLTQKVSGATVTIDPGCALTTDGDLLTVDAPLKLTHSRPFTDEDAKYKLLADLAPFTELLTTKGAAGDDSVSALTADVLKNTVVAIYLESFAKEPEFCTGDNCDNKGPVQHNNIRFLLLPKAKVAAVPAGLPEIAVALPEINAARTKLTTGIKKLEGNDGLQAAFTTAIAATRADLVDSLGQLASNTGFRDVMRDAGFDKAPDWNAKLPGKTLSPAAEIKGLLHVYGFFRDFCDAYEEWRRSLYCLRGICAPDPEAFPKHILLGETGRSDRCPRDIFRYAFMRASPLGGCDDALEKSRMLWQRLIGLAAHFDQSPSAPVLRITPSAAPAQPLGQRALPFYYGAEFDAPWNVDARLQCAPDQPISYHQESETAFNFDLARRPFYRIEGHLGKRLADVETELKNLRTRHNLAFQIQSIQIEDDPDLVVLPPIRFFDLESLFHHHTLDLKLRLRDAESFSDVVTTEAGKAPESSVAKAKATEVSQASGQLKSSAREATEKMPSRFSAFTEETNVTVFNTALAQTIEHGIKVNKLAYDFAKYTPVTPTDRLTRPEALTRFGHLFDLYKNRLIKVRERSIFQKFVSNNPGLEHLGGVPAGGTLVLVYSASANANQRIVKADFCLPYFSYFDLTTLEEEEPPVDITVKPAPPYVFNPKPWKDIYQWTFTPITETFIDNKFSAFTASISQIKFDLAKDLDVLVNSKIVEGILPLQTGTFSSSIKPRLAASSQYSEMFAIIEANKREIDRLRSEKERGIAPPKADERIGDLELHNAELLGKASISVTEEIAKAEAAGKPVAAAEREMAEVIKANAVTLESDQAKSAFKGSITTAVTQNATSDLVKANFGNLAKLF